MTRMTIEDRAGVLQALPEGDLRHLCERIYGSTRRDLLRSDLVCAILDYEYGYAQTRTIYPDWGARVEALDQE